MNARQESDLPTTIIAGNWKMNTTAQEARALVSQMRDALDAVSGVTSLLCPPFVHLESVAEALRGTSIALGAQNMHPESAGAFTGEVSPEMLRGLCEYVILGHSERRELFGETDEFINRKARAAIAAGLRPILCVGESLEQRDCGEAESVVARQLALGLEGVDDASALVVAYEPVWAIGTGRAATPETAQAMMAHLRGELTARYGADAANEVPLLYGGSVNAANAADYARQPDVNGALVGGASLDADAFTQIARLAAQSG